MFFFSVECSYRKKGDQIADYGDSCDGKGYIPPRQDYRICLDKKLSGHLYYAQMLLNLCESDTDDKSGRKTYERYHPSLEYEYLLNQAFLSSKTSKGVDVRPFLDNEH